MFTPDMCKTVMLNLIQHLLTEETPKQVQGDIVNLIYLNSLYCYFEFSSESYKMQKLVQHDSCLKF